MSETIKAKTSQRLRRRLGCHLRVSLTSRRNTIVPLLSLLLLLKILADASYHSVLPSEGSWHPPSLRPPVRVLVTSQTRCPSCDALTDSVVLDAESPHAPSPLRAHDA